MSEETVKSREENEGTVANQNIDNKPEEITMSDAIKAYLRWHFVNEIPHSFDRFLAASLLWALTPILKKLYKDEDALVDAYERHLLFFNTQLTWGGGIITGLMASMEETRAHEEYNNEEITMTDDFIYNTKAGLMGALAGIGDAIDSGTVQYILIAIALPWAEQGLAIGALFPFITFAIYQLAIGVFFARQAFTLGRSATEIMESAGAQNAINFLSILGLFMMGILAADYVDLSSTLEFTVSGEEFIVQDMIDSVIPGLLPLVTVMGVYYYYRKNGLNIMKALLYLTVILGVLAFFGIL